MKILDMPLWKPSDLIATDIAAMAEMVEACKRAFAKGRIWITTESTNPAEYIGGSWKSIGSGRVLMTPGFTYDDGESLGGAASSYSEAGKTGGSATHRHLTAQGSDGSFNFTIFGIGGDGGTPVFGSEVIGDATGVGSDVDYKISHSQERVAYTKMHGNLPPFYTVYIWERVG